MSGSLAAPNSIRVILIPLPDAFLMFRTATRVWLDRRRVRCASRLPALSTLILHVFEWCPKEQMVWVYTRRVVASVTHKHPGRNRSVGALPGNATGDVDSTSMLESTVTITRSRAYPLPAFIWTKNWHVLFECSWFTSHWTVHPQESLACPTVPRVSSPDRSTLPANTPAIARPTSWLLQPQEYALAS